jgi:tripartite-type tricarboxylate transporter receptor subunit TctC
MAALRSLSWILGLLVATSPLAAAQAQTYPTRTLTMIAPWTAGGAVGTVARIVASTLTERLGKTVVVENRSGDGSTIGTAAAAGTPQPIAGRPHARG